jgi:hypothetical protein
VMFKRVYLPVDYGHYVLDPSWIKRIHTNELSWNGCRKHNLSRQPLNDKMLIPNNALHETIHEHMGTAGLTNNYVSILQQACRCVDFPSGKIDCYLQSVRKEISSIPMSKMTKDTASFNAMVSLWYFCSGKRWRLLFPRHLVPAATDSVISSWNWTSCKGKSVYDYVPNSSEWQYILCPNYSSVPF